MDVANVVADWFVPLPEVTFIHAINGTVSWHLNIFIGKDKLAQARVKGERMDTRANGVHQHRAWPIENVSSGDLFSSVLQQITGVAVDVISFLLANRKNRTNIQINV